MHLARPETEAVSLYNFFAVTHNNYVCVNITMSFLPSATKLQRLYFYTCLSVCLSACRDTTPHDQAPSPASPRSRPLRTRHPQSRHPPGADTPQQTATAADGNASYWNAFLLKRCADAKAEIVKSSLCVVNMFLRLWNSKILILNRNNGPYGFQGQYKLSNSGHPYQPPSHRLRDRKINQGADNLSPPPILPVHYRW